MTDSRTTHGALTEGVRKTMSGKGREGNKEGKGRLREPFTTSSSYVPREVVQPRSGHPRDVMVSATRLDEHTDLQAIEHLDFDPAIPCGCWDYDDLGERCPRTADVIVEDVPCPHCIGRSSRARWLCSDVCWTEMAELGTECATCGVIAPRDEALRLVGRLR